MSDVSKTSGRGQGRVTMHTVYFVRSSGAVGGGHVGPTFITEIRQAMTATMTQVQPAGDRIRRFHFGALIGSQLAAVARLPSIDRYRFSLTLTSKMIQGRGRKNFGEAGSRREWVFSNRSISTTPENYCFESHAPIGSSSATLYALT